MTARTLTPDQLDTIRFMRGQGQRFAFIARVFGFGTVDGLVDAIIETACQTGADLAAVAEQASLGVAERTINETAPSGAPAAGADQPPRRNAGTAAACQGATGQPLNGADEVPPLREVAEGAPAPDTANVAGQSARPTSPPGGRRGRPKGSRTSAKPARRFTGNQHLRPDHRQAALAADHPAVTEARTLFPSTVVAAADAERLLVSGINSRKIGDRVAKGPWRGMPIHTLTLEERATCPPSCHLLRECYGNAMPFARRHRHGDDLIQSLYVELWALHHQHKGGFAVRLHVLGDFWSLEYVEAWRLWLRDHPGLHVFGFTAWVPGQEPGIGDAVAALNAEFPDRCAIRFSVPPESASGPMQSTTIWRLPEAARVPEGIVCPAQTGATDCCGTCALCWAPAARHQRIVFIGHGKRNGGRKRHESQAATPTTPAAAAPARGDRKPPAVPAIAGPVPAVPPGAAVDAGGPGASGEAGGGRRDTEGAPEVRSGSRRRDHQPDAPARRVAPEPRRSDRSEILPIRPIPPARTCQWNDGEPEPNDACKCGKPSAPGRSYCAAHTLRAYQFGGKAS